MEVIRRAHVDDVARVVDAAGGRLIKTLGDGAMASFDSALGALHAAAGIQVAVERLDAAQGGIGVAARVGVAAGEPIRDGEDLHGMAVVIAVVVLGGGERGGAGSGSGPRAGGLSRDGVALEDPESYELKGVLVPVRASSLRWREIDSRPGVRDMKVARDGQGPRVGSEPGTAAGAAADRPHAPTGPA